MTPQRLFSALVICLAVGTVARAADDSYAIKLHRPNKVGDHYDTHIVVEESQTQSVDSGGPAPRVQTKSSGADLTGRVEVTEIDKNGDEVGMVLTVKKLADAQGKELLESGKEIVVKRSAADVTFTAAEGEISDDARALLRLMFSSNNPDGPTDDDIFGSKAPHQAGDQWNIDADRAAKSLSESGTKVDVADLRGKVTLKGVENVNGVAMLRVTGEVDADNVKPPPPGPGIVTTSCSVQMHFTGLYPTDTALPTYERQVQMDMQKHDIVTGTPTNSDVSVHRQLTETMMPVKK